MPLLQVRDCPDDIYKEISMVAHKQNRTIAQQTIVLLKKGLGLDESNKERRKTTLERIQARTIPDELKKIDFVKLIREDRDRCLHPQK
jgi:hypothetical protein